MPAIVLGQAKRPTPARILHSLAEQGWQDKAVLIASRRISLSAIPRTRHAAISPLEIQSRHAFPAFARAQKRATDPTKARRRRKRSEEGRVGKEGVQTCRYRWLPYH